jgi:Leucine-rich repeat (LRR) protein
LASKDFSAK